MHVASLCCLMALCCIWCSSCGDRQRLDVMDFQRAYAALPAEAPSAAAVHAPEETLTLTASAVPLVDLLRLISDQTHVSVIAAENLDKQTISLEVKKAPVDSVLGAVARRLGQRLTKIGSIFYIGQISPEDRGFLVRRVHRLSKDELDKVLGLFTSEYGRSVAFSDGLVVFTDRVEILERLSLAIDAMEQAPSTSWVMQLYLVQVSKGLQHKLGIDLSQSLTFGYRVNASPSTASVTGALNALLVSTHSDSDSRVEAQPLFLLRDGSTSTLTDGVSQPIPKYTVSPEGTTQISGYDIVDVGLLMSATVREESAERASLHLSIESSRIDSYYKDYPVIVKQKFDGDVSVESGGTYLVGALSQKHQLHSLAGDVAPTVWDHEASTSDLQIWLRCYRVSGAALDVPHQVVEPAHQVAASSAPGS